MLDATDTLRSGGDAGAAARSGVATAQVPSPPPPPAGDVPPAPGTAEARRLRRQRLEQERAALRKSERHDRWQAWTGKARSVNRQVWVVGAGALVLGCAGWFVRDTWLDLAAIKATPTELAPPPITTDPAPPTVVQGLANPLSELPLTGPAQFALGWSAQTGDLSPVRSGAALAQILDGVDVCAMFIGLDNEARVLVQREQFPGSYPMCGAREVATPNDMVPLPTTTVAPVETTTTVAG